MLKSAAQVEVEEEEQAEHQSHVEKKKAHSEKKIPHPFPVRSRVFVRTSFQRFWLFH